MALIFSPFSAIGRACGTRLLQTCGTVLKRSISEAAALEDEELTQGNVAVEELVEMGMNQFKTMEKAYMNFDPNDISFVVVKDTRGGPAPELVYKGRNLRNGLDHVTPWAVVNFADLGTKGTLGKLIYGTKDLLSDPAAAKQQLGFGVKPRHEGEALNEDMINYIDWLKKVEGRLCDHISENLFAYPRLNAKFGGQEQFLKNMLQMSLCHKSERYCKDPQGKKKAGTEYVTAQRPLYNKAFSPPTHFQCAFDEEMYSKHNLVRHKVAIIDNTRNELPLTTKPVDRNFIVSCSITLSPLVFEALCGVKKGLDSVTILTVVESYNTWRRNPWASMRPIRGGYVHMA